jgi:DNA-binding winged helix-turn-helix (wHTH) protein/tetratricopeptide (TPR) repeat protein
MGNPTYHFGPFSLSPLARELRRDGQPVALSASAFDCLVYLVEHRERPVGKDELIAAVWGRVDVSDSLLAQTIVRLRRALDEAGDETPGIKTVSRVGYRWMRDTSVTHQHQVDSPAEHEHAEWEAGHAAHGADEAPIASTPARKLSARWRNLIAAMALIVAGVAGYMTWHRYHSAAVQSNIRFDTGSAIVLPAEVDAPDDWKWLQFGLMDLISNRLRDARIPTETSQAVLDLLKENPQMQTAGPSSSANFALVVHTRVTLNGDSWLAHLDARSQDGREWKAESSSTDVLKAVRAASDVLLAQLGYGVQASGGQTPVNTKVEYMQRIDAARLAGQPSVARELIDKAPADLRDTPEMAYVRASVDCDEGNSAVCKQELLDLLQRLTDKKDAMVRGEILTTLGILYSHNNDLLKSVATLTEAINTLQGHEGAALATAYLDRSYLEQILWRLDEATTDLGRARALYALSGDAVGATKADFEMGILAERRAQPDAAMGLLERSYDQFQRMGMRSMLPSVIEGMTVAQSTLLKFKDELAATDRFWPLDAHDMGFMDRLERRELTMVRAIALADNGRTAEAGALAQALIDDNASGDDPSMIAETNKLLAEIALGQGDYPRAAELATRAMTPALHAADERDYAATWLVRISALQRTGHLDDARREVASMADWQSHLPFKDDWIAIYVMHAKAMQTWAEGNHAAAIDQFKSTLAEAEKLGVPDVVLSVGEPYALALLDAGQLDQAMAISGRLSVWSTVDWRAAWVEARVYLALGQTDSWNKSRAKAQELAGDRPLPATTPAHLE